MPNDNKSNRILYSKKTIKDHEKEIHGKGAQGCIPGIRKRDGGPFGACITKGSRIIAVSHNTVLKKNDPTCHAEINAIRKASQKLKRWSLKGCKIYSTTEPCPMCFSAIHWAQIGEIVYGTGISDVRKLGFNELALGNKRMKRMCKLSVRIVKNFMRDECLKLLAEWQRIGGRVY